MSRIGGDRQLINMYVSILIFSSDETPTIDTIDEFHRFDLPESGTAMTDAAGEEGLARLAPMIKKKTEVIEKSKRIIFGYICLV